MLPEPATGLRADTPRFIAVEGPIGVGKTSLAKRLAASLGYGLLLEKAEENPFLDRFYEDPGSMALPTQLFFLFQRIGQMQQFRQGDLFRPPLVADFLMDKDRLFAEATLHPDELSLYEQVADLQQVDIPIPDLVVYLQAPVEVLRDRIAGRARAMELGIDTGYLETLVEGYAKFFHDYDQAPLLIVNTTDIDPVSSDEDYALLAEQIRTIRSGRRFFNPATSGAFHFPRAEGQS